MNDDIYAAIGHECVEYDGSAIFVLLLDTSAVQLAVHRKRHCLYSRRRAAGPRTLVGLPGAVLATCQVDLKPSVLLPPDIDIMCSSHVEGSQLPSVFERMKRECRPFFVFPRCVSSPAVHCPVAASAGYHCWPRLIHIQCSLWVSKHGGLHTHTDSYSPPKLLSSPCCCSSSLRRVRRVRLQSKQRGALRHAPTSSGTHISVTVTWGPPSPTCRRRAS